MAELTPKERLQPSLLDRLTDDEPGTRQESRDKRVLSPAQLRESVRRDLTWLFNSSNLESALDPEAFPLTAASTLNYGLPAIAGQPASAIDLSKLERTLRQVIATYEPRLLKDTVKLRAAGDKREMNHNAIAFYIEAHLWNQPLPIRLYLKTEIDLEAGSARVTDLGG
jgi:type VI secretion system protein ImpF